MVNRLRGAVFGILRRRCRLFSLPLSHVCSGGVSPETVLEWSCAGGDDRVEAGKPN